LNLSFVKPVAFLLPEPIPILPATPHLSHRLNLQFPHLFTTRLIPSLIIIQRIRPIHALPLKLPLSQVPHRAIRAIRAIPGHELVHRLFSFSYLSNHMSAHNAPFTLHVANHHTRYLLLLMALLALFL